MGEGMYDWCMGFVGTILGKDVSYILSPISLYLAEYFLFVILISVYSII